MPGANLVTLFCFATPKLDVVVVLLFPFSFSRLVIRLAAGTGTENYCEDDRKTPILFHSALFRVVNTTSPLKRTAFEL